MRRIIENEGLMRGKNQVTEGRANFTVSEIKLEEWFPWKKVCHTCLKPSC